MDFGSNDAASFHLLHKVFTKGLNLLSHPKAECVNTHTGRKWVCRTPLTVQEVAQAEDRKDTISRRGRLGATSNKCHVSARSCVPGSRSAPAIGAQ